MNLINNKPEVFTSLQQFSKYPSLVPMVYGTVFNQDQDMEAFGIKGRNNFDCAIVVAAIKEKETSLKFSEKIGLFYEKMKDGILILFQFGIKYTGKLVTHTRKSIIITGNQTKTFTGFNYVILLKAIIFKLIIFSHH